MKITTKIVAALAVATALSACTGRDPKPDSYWQSHPHEAKEKKAWCIDHQADMEAASQKPPRLMTADERECYYLFVTGDYDQERKYQELKKQRLSGDYKE